MKHTVVDEEPG